jgi:uncharacterized protein YaiE (UPF0345 family)
MRREWSTAVANAGVVVLGEIEVSASAKTHMTTREGKLQYRYSISDKCYECDKLFEKRILLKTLMTP